MSPLWVKGFPSSSVGKESACNAGNLGLISGSGRSPGEGNGNPLQYSCLGNPMDRGAWQATVYGVARVGHDLATTPPLVGKVSEERGMGIHLLQEPKLHKIGKRRMRPSLGQLPRCPALMPDDLSSLAAFAQSRLLVSSGSGPGHPEAQAWFPSYQPSASFQLSLCSSSSPWL